MNPHDAHAGEALHQARTAWARLVGYVAQGASWCVCSDGSCRVCEAARAGLDTTDLPPREGA